MASCLWGCQLMSEASCCVTHVHAALGQWLLSDEELSALQGSTEHMTWAQKALTMETRTYPLNSKQRIGSCTCPALILPLIVLPGLCSRGNIQSILAERSHCSSEWIKPVRKLGCDFPISKKRNWDWWESRQSLSLSTFSSFSKHFLDYSIHKFWQINVKNNSLHLLSTWYVSSTGLFTQYPLVCESLWGRYYLYLYFINK